MEEELSGITSETDSVQKIKSKMVFLQYGEVDAEDYSFVVKDKNGVRKSIPGQYLACLLLETGTIITHEAVSLAADLDCLILWVGDGGVRLYSTGQPGGAFTDRLLYQAKAALDDTARLKVVRKMYELRFGSAPPENKSVQQLRGMEGARVRALYKFIGRQYGITWNYRSYNPKEWNDSDPLNQAISSATASLYGICEAGILSAGYSPSIGFIHTGKPQSFVYDVADIFKFDTVVPAAFKVIAERSSDPQRDARIACRDFFRKTKLLKKIIPTIERVLHSSGINDTRGSESVFPESVTN